jgi:hypothetical protein
MAAKRLIPGSANLMEFVVDRGCITAYAMPCGGARSPQTGGRSTPTSIFNTTLHLNRQYKRLLWMPLLPLPLLLLSAFFHYHYHRRSRRICKYCFKSVGFQK